MLDEEPVLEEIYSAFQPKILRYMTRLVGEHEAEDLTQEVFLRISRSLKNFKGNSQMSTWIYRIATNTALDRLSIECKQKLAKQGLPIDSIMDEEDKNIWTDDKVPSIEQQLILLEMHQCIHKYIGQLPVSYQVILVLSDLEGFKNKEIAETLGLNLSTVKIRLHRARARLKKELEAGCRFYYDERNRLACEPKNILQVPQEKQ